MRRRRPDWPRRQVRNARLLREPDRVQTRMLLLGLAAGLVLLLPLLANIWGHAEAVRLGYRLEAARGLRDELLQSNRLLRAEHAALRSYDRIQRLAIDKLGLVPRDPAVTVVVTVVTPPLAPGAEPPTEEMVVARAGAPAAGQGAQP